MNKPELSSTEKLPIPFQNIDQAQTIIEELGRVKDDDIDLLQAALALSYFDKNDADIDKSWALYQSMLSDLESVFDDHCATANSDSAWVQASALQDIFAKKYGFIGDDITYDDFRNINLFDVMDRRMGMPISLCVLTVSLCRSMGWQACGVNFPGHFIMRLDKDGERLLIDPFQGCKILDAKDLRLILKRVMGGDAELSAHYYDPCDNRNTLLRHQNNLKFRLIDKENYEDALNVTLRMEIIAPNDYRVFLDKAVLYARLEQVLKAIEAIKKYLEHATDQIERAEAEQFLYELQRQLN